MNRLFPYLLLLTLLSCVSLSGLDTGRPRSSTVGGEGKDTPSKNPPPDKLSNNIYVSGIRVPDDYDWHRDTACGLASCEAVLFLDGKEILSFPTGYEHCVSTEPDTHHLLDGHLYTEFTDATGTIIKRDGVMLFRYEGRECLAGLLVKGRDIYTLGKRKTGYGFSFRKNGSAVFISENGVIDGGFSYPGAGRNGALFCDGEQIWFSYKERSSTQVTLVRDGRASPFLETSMEVLNLRVWDGKSNYVYNHPLTASTYLHTASGNKLLGSTKKLNDTMLGIVSGSLFCILNFTDRCTVMQDGGYSFDCSGDSIIRIVGNESRTEAIVIGKDGEVNIYEDGALSWTVDPCFIFSASCAMMYKSSLILALSPRTDGDKPRLWAYGRTLMEFEMNGFLTGVEYCVSPPM